MRTALLLALLALFQSPAPAPQPAPQDATARYVSASKGWTRAEVDIGRAIVERDTAALRTRAIRYAQFNRWRRDAGAQGPLDYAPYTGGKPAYMRPGETIRDRYFWGSDFLALTTTGNLGLTAPILADFTLRNVAIKESRLWAIRAYRIQANVRLIDVTIDGVRNEHGIYGNMAGLNTPQGGSLDEPALLIRRLHARNIGSQVVQLVFRSGETGWPALDDTPGGPIIIEDSFLEDVTHWAGTRSAFSLTFFPTKNPVAVLRVVVDNRRQARSRGLMVCQGFQTGYGRDLLVEDLTAIYGVGDRELVKLDWLDDITIRRSHFEVAEGHPMPRIDVNGLRGKLVVEGCSGNVLLRVDVDGDGEHEYQGPISDGYPLTKEVNSPTD